MADRELALIEEEEEADRLTAQIGQFGYTVRRIKRVETLATLTELLHCSSLSCLTRMDGKTSALSNHFDVKTYRCLR